MRVAVHFPEDHPQSPGAVAAYRLGRVEDGVHNKMWHTGEVVPINEFMARLVADARAEHPDCEIVVERLVRDGEDGTWVPVDEAVAEAVAAGEHQEHEVGVSQTVETASDGGQV